MNQKDSSVRRQARAEQALRGHSPDAEPGRVAKELGVCLGLCKSWHTQHRVAQAEQYYLSFPKAVSVARDALWFRGTEEDPKVCPAAVHA